MASGASCERCGDTVWADPLPLAWLGRHRHGTSTAAYCKHWHTGTEGRP